MVGLAPSKPIPFVVAALAVAGEAASYFARSRYSNAEWLQRKLDMLDSLGWEVTAKEWTDFLARCPKSVKGKSRTDPAGGAFFASQDSPGARKAFQNMLESAWWSKHLCERMYQLYFFLLGVAILGSIAALIVSLEVAPIRDEAGRVNRDALSAVANAVTSVLMLVISLRLAEAALGFLQFSREAERCEDEAEAALAAQSEDTIKAAKLWHEYQLERAIAPVLPTWIWKMRRDELNDLWRTHRQNQKLE